MMMTAKECCLKHGGGWLEREGWLHDDISKPVRTHLRIPCCQLLLQVENLSLLLSHGVVQLQMYTAK